MWCVPRPVPAAGGSYSGIGKQVSVGHPTCSSSLLLESGVARQLAHRNGMDFVENSY
jgi:hypothetical protein